MLLQLANILAPIIIITLIGYVIGRSSIGFDARTLSTVVIMIATPAIIFHTLTSRQVPTETIETMAGAALLCVAVAAVFGVLALRFAGASVRSFLPALIMPNSGNLGLPLATLAFGAEGMQMAVAYFFVIALVQNTVGLWMYAGSVKVTEFLKLPLIYSVIAVIIVTWGAVPVPQIVLTSTEMLGGMMIPAMLILLGVSLSTLEVADLRPAALMAVARLVIGILSSFVVIYILGLDGSKAGTVFLMGTMPTAILIYVFAERYQFNARQIAGSVVVSTLLTFAFLPVLVWFALHIAGH